MKENEERVVIEEPRLARLIFADTRFGWLWLPLRLSIWVGPGGKLAGINLLIQSGWEPAKHCWIIGIEV